MITRCSAPAPTIHPLGLPPHMWANPKFHSFDHALGKRRHHLRICDVIGWITTTFESNIRHSQNERFNKNMKMLLQKSNHS